MRSWIEEGVFREGCALPSERELAQRLGVARTTVRAALDELQTQALVERAGQRQRRVVQRRSSQAHIFGRTVGIPTDLGRISREFPHFPHGWDLFTYQRCVQALQERGYHALLMAPASLDGEHLAQTMTGRPMGMLLTAESPALLRGRLIASCRAHRVPLVADGDAPDVQDFDRAGSDHAAGCGELTRFMLDAGRRRVVCFWPHLDPYPYWLDQRRAGYEAAMQSAGRRPLPVAHYPLLPTLRSIEHNRAAVFERNVRTTAGHLLPLLSGPEPADALLCLTDAEASQVIAALRLAGRSPERDVWVAGYDNTWPDEITRQFESAPPRVTIEKRNDEVGVALAQLLIERTRTGLDARPQRCLVAPTLVAAFDVAAQLRNSARSSV